MTTTVTTLDLACTNAVRTLAIDMIQKANSGHPGLPLGAAPMASVLWRKAMKFDAADPVYATIGNGANDTFDQIVVIREQDAGVTNANTELLATAFVPSTTTNGGNITLIINVEGLLQLT